MKQENNGKIAIAIVAMFVVALSVVGFTYAYFTARVQGNTADKSVDVVAGKLSIVYTGSQNIYARNLVPGWVSDNAHYFDPVYSVEEVNGEHHISAVNTTDHATKSDNTTPAAADGITPMAQFTVANDSDNTAEDYYVIELTDIVNEIGTVTAEGANQGQATTDAQYLWVTLYQTISGTDTVIWSGNLTQGTSSSKGTQVIVPSVRTIQANADAQSYKVKLTYQNVTDASQESLNKSVSAKVAVVGVAQNSSNQWVTETGTQITFPAANTTDPALTVTSGS